LNDLPTHEGHADFRGCRTWYRVTGPLGGGQRPLVTLHGGPGAAHDYLERFGALARTGRAVIHYDQLGSGRSTHLPEKGADFWTVELFLAELDNLLRHVGIADYHLLGQSWGGMLGSEHATRQPKGLRSLTIANSPASMELWVSEANRLRKDLPPAVQDALNRHEAAGTTADPEYKAAERVFYDRHLCRVSPWPDELVRSFA
jgi:L-proline amide hydrolase